MVNVCGAHTQVIKQTCRSTIGPMNFKIIAQSASYARAKKSTTPDLPMALCIEIEEEKERKKNERQEFVYCNTD